MASNRVIDCLHQFEPRPGDCLFLPAGTVHALGAGIVLYEVQQTSDVTFRLYDWDRTDRAGNPRPLHLAESLEVIDFERGRTTTKLEWTSCSSGCSEGRVSTLIDGNGNQTTWDHDIQGRVVKETRADGNFWTYAYEGTTSRLETVTDPKNQVKTFTYSLDDKHGKRSALSIRITSWGTGMVNAGACGSASRSPSLKTSIESTAAGAWRQSPRRTCARTSSNVRAKSGSLGAVNSNAKSQYRLARSTES